MPSFYMISTNNRTKLAVAIFSTARPKGIVQIIHGALEHKERYYDFAQFLRRGTQISKYPYSVIPSGQFWPACICKIMIIRLTQLL